MKRLVYYKKYQKNKDLLPEWIIKWKEFKNMNKEISAAQYQKMINGGKKPKKVKTNSPTGKITENEVQRQILDWLCLKQIFNWRQNTMGVYMGDGQFRQAPSTGVSDILGVLKDGRFLAIEVKRPGGKATDDQKEFIDNVNANNGFAFVADSLDVVIEKLEDKA